MRFGWVYILLFSVLRVGEATGQENVAITWRASSLPLEEILHAIEQQSGYVFSYESSLLYGLPPVSFEADGNPLSLCLDRLLGPLSLSYTLSGRYIILRKKTRMHTLSGFIRDSLSSESLISASVYNGASGKGTAANSYGFYSLTLPPGPISLRVSYVGYHPKEITVDLQRDTVLPFLLAPWNALKEVVVEALPPSSEVLSSRTGVVQFSSRTIRSVPSLFGEPDVLRTLQQTPGVSPGTEGLTGLYVRGGNGDENLYLIDGNPVYHVNHVGGLFSTFNPDAVKNVEFYRGSFPARYGGRLSSVVDVRMKEGDLKAYHGGISIGLLSATAYAEGPLVKDRTSFYLAFRRTWMDAFTAPALAIWNKIHKERDKAGYSFYDLNGKINHHFSDRSRLSLSVYAGQDRVRSGTRIGTHTYSDWKWRWGNFVSSLNWNYVIAPQWFARLAVNYTRFQSRMWTIKETDRKERPGKRASREETVQGSCLEDWGYRLDVDYMPAPAHHIKLGSDYLFHQYRPEQHWTTSQTFSGDEPAEQRVVYSNQYIPAHEWSLYAEDDWRIGRRWKINPGLRLATYHVQGHTYCSLQPRISARYLMTSQASVKVSYAKMNQYVHQLSNSYMNLPSDIWVPVTGRIPPMASYQTTAGVYYRWKKTLDLSLEGYYKEMDHLIEYRDGASLYPAYTGWEKKIALGEGRSYGMEMMVRKPAGRLSGWVAYTLSWTDRVFHDGTVNGGIRFPARYDNRHNLNIAMLYKINPKVELSASWTYRSGNRMTVQMDAYRPPYEMSPGHGATGGGRKEGAASPSTREVRIPGASSEKPFAGGKEPVFRRNGVQLSGYHRLDIGINIYRQTRRGHLGIWNVSLYNAYCRVNPFSIESVRPNTDGTWRVRQKGYFPVIPSFSYTYKF